AGTDILGVSFSSPDLVGHSFGPRSQEVQDMYARLDRTIGILLERLDALVGRDQYVVALSSDHGVSTLPEQLIKEGQGAGRFDPISMNHTIEKAVETALGSGTYLTRVNGND